MLKFRQNKKSSFSTFFIAKCGEISGVLLAMIIDFLFALLVLALYRQSLIMIFPPYDDAKVVHIQ